MKYARWTIFLIIFGCFLLKSSDFQLKNHEIIKALIDRCRQRIKEFESLNDPFDCLTVDEMNQLSYDDKQKLLDEARNACLYYADLR